MEVSPQAKNYLNQAEHNMRVMSEMRVKNFIAIATHGIEKHANTEAEALGYAHDAFKATNSDLQAAKEIIARDERHFKACKRGMPKDWEEAKQILSDMGIEVKVIVLGEDTPNDDSGSRG